MLEGPVMGYELLLLLLLLLLATELLLAQRNKDKLRSCSTPRKNRLGSSHDRQ